MSLGNEAYTIGQILKKVHKNYKKGELHGHQVHSVPDTNPALTKALHAKKEGKPLSYLHKERKNNAEFMRNKGYEDVLATRKSIGRHGEK